MQRIKWKQIGNMLIALVLILLGTPLSKANSETPILTETIPGPTFQMPQESLPQGTLLLKKSDVKALAQYKKSCDLAKKDLSSTKAAYTKCIDNPDLAATWWNHPLAVAGFFVSGIVAGYALGK